MEISESSHFSVIHSKLYIICKYICLTAMSFFFYHSSCVRYKHARKSQRNNTYYSTLSHSKLQIVFFRFNFYFYRAEDFQFSSSHSITRKKRRKEAMTKQTDKRDKLSLISTNALVKGEEEEKFTSHTDFQIPLFFFLF